MATFEEISDSALQYIRERDDETHSLLSQTKTQLDATYAGIDTAVALLTTLSNYLTSVQLPTFDYTDATEDQPNQTLATIPEALTVNLDELADPTSPLQEAYAQDIGSAALDAETLLATAPDPADDADLATAWTDYDESFGPITPPELFEPVLDDVVGEDFSPAEVTFPELPQGAITPLEQIDFGEVPEAPTTLNALTRTDLLISDTEWDRLFDRAADDVARKEATETFQAQNLAAMRGVAVPPILMALGANSAQHAALAEINRLRRDSVVEQAKAHREDTKTVFDSEARKFDSEVRLFEVVAAEQRQRHAAMISEETERFRIEQQKAADELKVKQDLLLKEWELRVRLGFDSERARYEIRKLYNDMLVNNQTVVAEFNLKQWVANRERETAEYQVRTQVGVNRFSTRVEGATRLFATQREAVVAAYTAERNAVIEEFRAKYQVQVEQYKAQVGAILDRHRAFWDSHLRRETLKLEFDKAEFATALDKAKAEAEFDLRKNDMAVKVTLGQVVDATNIYAQLVTAFLSASDASLGTSASISLSGDA